MLQSRRQAWTLIMDFKNMMSIVGVVITLIGIFVAPWLAVRLSLKQFRSTRWWEKQAEAYSNIMEQLAALQYTLGIWYDESLHLKDLSKSEKETLNEKYGEAREIIEKAAAAGAYLISDGASKTLTTLIKELNKSDLRGDWLSDLDRHYGAVRECITEMTRYSRKDLDIRN
jgi:hypothetical protein